MPSPRVVKVTPTLGTGFLLILHYTFSCITEIHVELCAENNIPFVLATKHIDGTYKWDHI